MPSADLPVRWVATSELADPTPYLEGGEVLLTTGLETADWHEEWRPYVERLVSAGVAALGLASGLTHRRPPRELLAACRAAGLNLFKVPRPTTFVAISRTAAGLLDAEREGAARRSLDAQRALTQAALDVEPLPALVSRLAHLVEGAAVLVDWEGEPIEGPHGPLGTDLDLAAVCAEVVRIRRGGLRAAASAASHAGTTLVRPVGARGRPEVWLAVLVSSRLDDVARLAVTTAVSLLSLAVEGRREQRAVGRRLRQRAVEFLLFDDPRTAQVVLSATAQADRAPRLPRQVAVVRARGRADAVEDALGVAENRRVLAAVVDGDLVAMATPSGAAAFADELSARGLAGGIGRTVPFDEVSASDVTATHALGATGPGIPVRAWDDLARGGVAGLLGPDLAGAFARSFLAPISDDPVLVATLGAFLRRHGSRGETADELSVHRNTVRNRVEQIETRLGASLDNPQVRVDAWVALQIMGSEP
ncbi:PucR family transcriptional regulator [Kribbella sp. NPDC050124]|uniref:PucR family transcriptional regulator n=1 Tax=Kribbella sp. NPDC050124 TaxID=3364114 RepID=UPI0037AB5B20